MDRYIYSNMAYQGALGFDPAEIWEKNGRFPRPDAVFYLDITPETGLKRISGRKGGANIGFEKADYLEKVYEIFGSKEFEAMEKVDASKTIEEIREIVWSKVSPLLG